MNPRRWLAAAAWGLFCSNSWTWCIGMYLPVILLRRFGWPGFLAFAIPNVLGCAAFGYVLRHKRSSEQLVGQHRTAMRWFSLVAIAYQMFFIPFFAAWFVLPVPDIIPASLHQWIALILAIVVLGAGVVVSLLPAKLWPVLAVATYGFSLAAFAQWGTERLTDIAWTGGSELSELLWLTPIIVFGFGLCPYLDLTFHRARQDSPSRHTFAVLGLTFAVLIVFTCAYAFERVLTPLLMWYVLAQAIFTIAAHLRELRQVPARGNHWKWLGLVAIPLAVAVLSYAITSTRDGNRAGETMYLRFLVFYGLIFPTYVLLFVGPGRTLRLSRKNVTAYALIVLVALPLFELGFIHGRSWLLILPLAGLFVLRWVAR